MLTLYHAPRSRSTRIVALIEELGIRDQVTIIPVGVTRMDGSGGPDPKNPHPEGKVPLLVHDGVEIRESTAIALYLTELFPDAGLALPVGHPERGRMLSWLAWYGDVFEPVVVFTFAELEHPLLYTTFRGMSEAMARLSEGLKDRKWLAGERYTIADLIICSTVQWAPDLLPEDPAIQDWATRCTERPAMRQAADFDASLMETT